MLNKKDLEEFIGLVTLSEKKKNTEVKMPSASARRVADGLCFLLLELQQLRQKLELTEQKLQENVVTSVELDGGSF
jgi:hypothetical protein